MVLLSKKSRWLFLLLIAVFLAGYAIYGSRQSGKAEPAASGVGTQQQQWWTCAMHPQIHRPKPGKCPICFMDLIPVASSGEDVGTRQIVFSEDALKLMDVQTTPVERKFVEAEVRMAGKVEYDESRVKEIAAWAPGRIDRL